MSNTNINRELNGLRPLAYLGVQPSTPPQLVRETRIPTTSDYQNFVIGTIWLVANTNEVWMLVDKQNHVATWIELSSGGNLTFATDDGNFSYPLAGVINIQGDTNIITASIPPDGNTVSITLLNGANGQVLIGGGANATWADLTSADGSVIFTPGANTLNLAVSGGGGFAGLIDDFGTTATPDAARKVTVAGGNNITTTSVANTLTIDVTGTTQHTVQIGNATASLTSMAVGLTGETIMGTTANDPFWTDSPQFGGHVYCGTGLNVVTGDATVDDGNINLPASTDSATGVLTVNAAPFLYSYGSTSIFLGFNAGNWTLNPTNAIANVGIGNLALADLVGTTIADGKYNVAVGQYAGRALTDGAYNVCIGRSAGWNSNTNAGIMTGRYNVIIGAYQGIDFNYNGTEASNILIGASVAGVVGESNTLRIGNGSGVNPTELNKAFIAGIRGRTTGVADAIPVLIDSANQLGTVSSSRRYKQNIQDMQDASSAILDLRPVTFEFKQHPGSMQYGLIAEEVQEIMPRLVVNDQEGLPETVKYHELPVLLLNELKKQQRVIEELTERITRLEV